MSKDGGGWTLTEMHTAGWNNQPIGRSMPDKGANEDQLMSRGDDFNKWKSGNMGDYASLGAWRTRARALFFALLSCLYIIYNLS